jgi:hypothetical protein
MHSPAAKLIVWAICGGVEIFWAQTLRCFLFGMRGLPGYEDWRDTAFVACASNPGLIQEVLDELMKPLSDRRHINGPIAAGDGGHNFNGPHRFAWHFVPNQWSLAEISIELCDGRPYSDVEQNLHYWLYQVGRFCPWASAPLREVSASNALAATPPKLSLNPTGDHLRVEAPYPPLWTFLRDSTPPSSQWPLPYSTSLRLYLCLSAPLAPKVNPPQPRALFYFTLS